MRSLFRLLVRIWAFIRKEIVEVLRQPRLILTLVLGPFLILLLFGIGYRNEPRVLRTLFVVDPNSPIQQEIEQFRDLGPQLNFAGVESDPAVAEEALRDGDVDVVVVAPPNAYEQIRNNEQATFTLYHNEIDPFQIEYISVFGRVYIDEVNRRVLRTIADQGQGEAVGSREQLAAARTSASEMRAALERGDVAAARQHQRNLERELDALEGTVGASLGLLEGVETTLGGGQGNAAALRGNLSEARQATLAMNDIPEGRSSYDAEIEEARQIEERLSALDSEVDEFQQVNSQVLVSPFTTSVQGIATVQPELAHYFAPAVIVLLLQHLAVTFAALSIVREVQLGTVELFRVSPVSPGETLLGKYLSYLLFGGMIAALLTVILVSNVPLPFAGPSLNGTTPQALALGLGVPMLGKWLNYAIAVTALLFTSLGLGFVISLIVDTDSQAVQYAMIVLLTSVFFSGFFLSLQSIWEPVRIVSWMMPATYTIQLLQDIMLRGNPGSLRLLGGLVGIGALLYLIAWLLMRRRMRRA